jgi:hypothetical protein
MTELQEWLFNEFSGKIVARLCVTLSAWVASSVVQGVLGHFGVTGVHVDPTQLAIGLIAAAHAAFEAFKSRRQKSASVVLTPPTVAP